MVQTPALFTGVLPSGTSPRDYQFSSVASLLTKQPPPTLALDRPQVLGTADRNQGSVASCVAFAAVTALQYHDDGTLLGPQFVYDRRTNWPQPGMTARDALDILLRQGVPPETDCPAVGAYNGSDRQKCIVTNEAMSHAQMNRIAAYYRIQSLDEIKLALANIGPVLLVLPQYVKGNGPFWTVLDNVNPSSHMVCVDGYDDGAQVLRIRSSLGGAAAVQLPYANLDTSAEWAGFVLEAWVLVPDLDEAGLAAAAAYWDPNAPRDPPSTLPNSGMSVVAEGRVAAVLSSLIILAGVLVLLLVVWTVYALFVRRW